MEPQERRRLIHLYKAGGETVAEALVGISETELDAQPIFAGWSPRQIVHHLADSETTSAIRLRRLLVEHKPVIDAYDEAEFARRLHYDRPIALDLALFGAVRLATAELLECLSDTEWCRGGSHSDSGSYSVDDWFRIYAAHGHEHAEQIREARRRPPICR